LELIQRRARETRSWDIDWKPKHLSASFHGRDLFAPVAAMLARGDPPPGRPRHDGGDRRADWPDDLCEIVYVDHYGNTMTRLRAAMLPPGARLTAEGQVLDRQNERAWRILRQPARRVALWRAQHDSDKNTS
jgi:S-adenosyl-L-methionine hydrolase (adenosine-forming)